jgi:hypothetical protein
MAVMRAKRSKTLQHEGDVAILVSLWLCGSA